MAYRRLVELECEQQKRVSLNAGELKSLLVNSIYAVERNRIACQISGFSLILAMLSYVDPPELHRCKIKFPTLIGNNLFREDFFDDKGMFWKKIVSPEGKNLRFDYIIGNPPWVESNMDDPKARYFKEWYNKHKMTYALARERTGEAFAWRIMECLAKNGIVGLILHAKTLTNDHLLGMAAEVFQRRAGASSDQSRKSCLRYFFIRCTRHDSGLYPTQFCRLRKISASFRPLCRESVFDAKPI